jgi:hypothetical protein
MFFRDLASLNEGIRRCGDHPRSVTKRGNRLANTLSISIFPHLQEGRGIDRLIWPLGSGNDAYTKSFKVIDNSPRVRFTSTSCNEFTPLIHLETIAEPSEFLATFELAWVNEMNTKSNSELVIPSCWWGIEHSKELCHIFLFIIHPAFLGDMQGDRELHSVS